MMNNTVISQGLGSTFLSIIVGSVGASAWGQDVNPNVHGLCKEAKDYIGCVRAMTTDVTAPPVLKTDQIVRPGLLNEMGNSCPMGSGYAGAGQCRRVVCVPMGIYGKNESELSGKGHTCEGKNLNYGILAGRPSIRWGDGFVPASIDPKCPAYEPDMGDPNSCIKQMRTGTLYTTGVVIVPQGNILLVKTTVGTARQLGIEDGDTVISINGKDAFSVYSSRQTATVPDEKFTMVFERSGRQFTHTLTATLQTDAIFQRKLSQ